MLKIMNLILESPFSQLTNENMTLKNIFLLIIMSFMLGLILSITYYLINKKRIIQRGSCILALIMPIIVAVAIFTANLFIEGNNFARALTLGGLFALVRFRSEPVSIYDLMIYTVGIICGLIIGLGYFLFAFIVALLFVAILVIAELIEKKNSNMENLILRILVPENYDFTNIFNEVLLKYTISFNLIKVKTSDFGTLFEVRYEIRLKNQDATKEFLDEIRAINSNLTVSLARKDQI